MARIQVTENMVNRCVLFLLIAKIPKKGIFEQFMDNIFSNLMLYFWLFDNKMKHSDNDQPVQMLMNIFSTWEVELEAYGWLVLP